MSSETFEHVDLPPQIQIGKLPADVRLPPSLTEREEIVNAARGGEAQAFRAFAAALGRCCPVLERSAGAKPAAADWHEYGREIADYLRGKGATKNEIQGAGYLCWSAVLSSLPDVQAARKAVGNSSSAAEERKEEAGL